MPVVDTTCIRKCNEARCGSIPRTACLVYLATSTVTSVHADNPHPRGVAIGRSLEQGQWLVLHHQRLAVHRHRPLGSRSRAVDPRATVDNRMSSSRLRTRSKNVFRI